MICYMFKITAVIIIFLSIYSKTYMYCIIGCNYVVTLYTEHMLYALWTLTMDALMKSPFHKNQD